MSRRVLAGASVVAFWVFLDLYLRIDLPGAGLVQHAAFRAVTDALQWLDVDRSRIGPVVGAACALVFLAAVSGRRGAALQRVVALALCAPVAVAVVVAALMERAGFAGWVAGAAVLFARKSLFGPRRDGWRVSVVTGAVGSLSAVAALVYLFQIVAADSSGYSLPEQLREAARGAPPPRTFLMTICAIVAGLAAAPALRRDPRGVGAALALAAVASAVGASPSALLSTTLVAVTAVALTAAAGPLLLGPVASDPWEARRWPGAALLPGALAVLLLAHAYIGRLFHCPEELPDGLTRIADPSEVFSVALGEGGDVLALSLRAERRIGHIRSPHGSGPFEIEATAPGPIPAPPPGDRELPGQTYATIEELVPAPGNAAFFATVLAGHHDFYSLASSPPGTVNNMVIRVRGDGAAADDAFWEGHLCWIGTLSWDSELRQLYLGCEYEPVLHRLDFDSKSIHRAPVDERLGDVAAIAVDPRRNRLFTVSLWDSDRVFELDRQSLEIVRSRRLGGTHYALAYDAEGGRLFAPSFYGSRVRIVDVEDLGVTGVIPTGLGARAVVHVPGVRDLLLASAVYDDVLRVCAADSGEVLEQIRVGGHVKSIAVDSERRLAYFWSQCGLFRLDLDRLDPEVSGALGGG